MTDLTLQEIFQKNLAEGKQEGITLINGNNKTEFLSYKKLYLEATYMLHDLHQKGLKSGDEIIFQFQSNRNFIVTFWACIFGKIIPIPVTFGVSLEVISKISNVWKKLNNPYIISDLESLHGILGQYYIETENKTFKEIQQKLILFEKPSYNEQVLPLPSDISDIVFVQFSSGSTGTPKGVINKQENILYNLFNSKKHLDIDEKDTFLGWMPLTHDMGLVFFHLLPLVTNAPQYLMPPIVFLTYPELWVESLAKYEISVSGSPNFGYKHALESIEKAQLNGLSFNNMRIMINSAEPISIHVCKSFTEALMPYGFSSEVIKPGYGLAEAVLGVSLCYGYTPQLIEYYVDRSNLQVGSEIKFLDAEDVNASRYADLGVYYGTEIKITNDKKEIQKNGFLGYINLRSKAITTGYYNDPEITKQLLSKDRWLNTGDLGFLRNEHLVITGRAKEMILIKGQNYFPNDLDKVIEELPQVQFQKAVCCSVFNDKKHQDDIYVFMQHEGTVEEFFDLSNLIKKHLKLTVGLGIAKMIKVPRIPKTTSGKIQRYVLRENYFKGDYDTFLEELEEIIQRQKAQIQQFTREEIESKILETLNTLLNVNDLTVSVNFFDLGITSLQVMQLKGHLESYIEEDLDEVIFFRYTNAKDLSEYIYNELLHDTAVVSTERTVDLSSAKARMRQLLKK